MAKILVVGSSNVDFIMGVERLPILGETVNDGVFHQTYGGKGANQAIAAARAGAQVIFVTSIGRDRYGDEMMDQFTADGMEVSAVVRSDSPSGSALVMIDRDGRNYLTVAPGSNFDLLPKHLSDSEGLFGEVSLLMLQQEVPLETNFAAACWARARGIPVMLNCAPADASHVSLLPGADILVVNENQAAVLTKISPINRATVSQAAKVLSRHGPEVVIIMLGAEGYFVWGKRRKAFVPSLPVSAIDTTAAGDAFCGYLGAAFVEGKTIMESVRWASAAAALAVTKVGAQSCIPRSADVQMFLENCGK